MEIKIRKEFYKRIERKSEISQNKSIKLKVMEKTQFK
jgi:hypothetical protein